MGKTSIHLITHTTTMAARHNLTLNAVESEGKAAWVSFILARYVSTGKPHQTKISLCLALSSHSSWQVSFEASLALDR